MLSVLAGSAALAWAFSHAGFDGAARVPLGLGFTWLIAQWLRWKWFAALGLFAFLAFAAYGLWIGLPSSLMILGALGGLLAWDLADFSVRLAYAAPRDDVRGMELRHIGRLLIMAVLGTALAALSAILQVRLTFELVLALVILTAVGLAQLVRWLQSRGE